LPKSENEERQKYSLRPYISHKTPSLKSESTNRWRLRLRAYHPASRRMRVVGLLLSYRGVRTPDGTIGSLALVGPAGRRCCWPVPDYRCRLARVAP